MSTPSWIPEALLAPGLGGIAWWQGIAIAATLVVSWVVGRASERVFV